MSHNANIHKAKMQAVGIYRKASPQAAINHGETYYSGGDYRVPEGAKTCYHPANTEEEDRALIARYLSGGGTIKPCRAFLNSSGRSVVPNDLNRKRGRALPQARGELVPGKADRAGSRVKWVMVPTA